MDSSAVSTQLSGLDRSGSDMLSHGLAESLTLRSRRSSKGSVPTTLRIWGRLRLSLAATPSDEMHKQNLRRDLITEPPF